MRSFVSVLFIFSFLTVHAQITKSPAQRAKLEDRIVQIGEPINLQQAISMALERNYQIRIAKSQEQISRNDFRYAYGAFLPTINGTFNNNNSVQNLRQDFLDNIRPRQEIYGALNRSSTVGLALNWNLFNGFGVFYNYDRLSELVKISEVNTRANVELTVADVATAYYDVIRQLQQLLSLRQALDISRERLDLARGNYEVGARSKVDFLTAQVDYNTDSSAMVAQEQNVRNAKVFLNTLLVRDPATEFVVQDTIIVRTDLAIERLREATTTNNPQLVTATLNRRIADLNTQLTRAAQLPVVNLLSGYNFTAIDNQGGFGVRRGRNDILTYGIQASIPIFTGFNQRRLINNAKTNALIVEYQQGQQQILIAQALEQTYSQYRNSLTLVNLENENYKIANENVDIAFERYRVGNSTAVEFRDVQRNAVAAETRLINAEYNTKISEIELLRLSSLILQEVGK